MVNLEISHNAPACIDENYPITVEVTNNDTQELDIVVDILLQPTEVDDAGLSHLVYSIHLIDRFTVNSISMGDELSSGLIKGVAFGTLSPGTSSVKTLHLISTGGAGDRILDISLQSRATVEGDTTNSPEDISEILKTVTVPTVHPLVTSHNIVYRRATSARLALTDLRSFDEDFWDDGEGGEGDITFTLQCTGPWSFELDGLEFIRKVWCDILTTHFANPLRAFQSG